MTTRDSDTLSDIPRQSPIYHAQRASQYGRQEMIRNYESEFSCRLVVMLAPITTLSVTMFEELIYDATPETDLHLLLWSIGGDGEAAIRIVRAAQSRCRELTIIVPDQAKSAATLLTLGAHHILMGPASDLGPIDPQLLRNNEWVAAKDIIAAVDNVTARVTEAPDTYAVYASLLSDITAVMLQQARSALDRTSDQLVEALTSNPDRTPEDVERLKGNLEGPMIGSSTTHNALFSVDDAIEAGLPVIKAIPSERQWQLIWRLWANYFALGLEVLYRGVYENARVSQM